MFYRCCILGVVLRLCVVVVVVCFNGLDVGIVGVQRWGTYYINFGAGQTIGCISNICLSLSQMIH